MDVLNETETLAYNWLLRQGLKPRDIVYQARKTPDFLTPEGNFEIKRAYITKNQKVVIVLSSRQRDLIQKSNAKILVFEETNANPIGTIEPAQLSQLVVNGIIIHITKEARNINLSLDPEDYWRFHEIKAILKAKTNEEALKKLMELVKK